LNFRTTCPFAISEILVSEGADSALIKKRILAGPLKRISSPMPKRERRLLVAASKMTTGRFGSLVK
jgi:hypothetical protein